MSKDETSTRLRFMPKKMGDGKGAVWRVYDLQFGSFPYQTPELGTVVQDGSESEIQVECDRLTAAHGYLNSTKKAAAGRSATKPTVTPVDDEDDTDADDVAGAA